MALVAALSTFLLLQEPSPKAEDRADSAVPTETSARSTDGRHIKEPTKKKYVAPEWPANAARAGLNGVVVLEFVVGVDGKVQDVKVLKGYQSLASAASSAVRKWRYDPAQLDGKAVPFIRTVTINFQLPSPPKRPDVLASLKDPDPEIRWAAVRWLGRYRPVTGDQRQALESAAQDANELVRSAAKDALEKLDPN